MNMDKYFMWIHYERLHNHNKAKHNKTVCIFLGIYCIYDVTNWGTEAVLFTSFNSLRPRRNGRYNSDNIFKCIFLKENVWILTIISMKFVVRVQLTIFQHLVQIMAWRRPGDKPLSEPMMVSLLTHICLTRPQWVNGWILMFANFHYELITGAVVGKWRQSTFSLLFTAYQMISSRTAMFKII